MTWLLYKCNKIHSYTHNFMGPKSIYCLICHVHFGMLPISSLLLLFLLPHTHTVSRGKDGIAWQYQNGCSAVPFEQQYQELSIEV